ncbi:hypothetical protein HMPREF0497_0082 [Lentilactobacillus buchneri ATCC 11577]|nr:hypothetical protein HMPREF0497_0082 [Lentilactobacillus buchneri ATCC 11577]
MAGRHIDRLRPSAMWLFQKYIDTRIKKAPFRLAILPEKRFLLRFVRNRNFADHMVCLDFLVSPF